MCKTSAKHKSSGSLRECARLKLDRALCWNLSRIPQTQFILIFHTSGMAGARKTPWAKLLVFLCVQGLPATVATQRDSGRAPAPARGAFNGSSHADSGTSSYFIKFINGNDPTQTNKVKLDCHSAGSTSTDCWDWSAPIQCSIGTTSDYGWFESGGEMGPFEIPAAESYTISFQTGPTGNADMYDMRYQIVDSQGSELVNELASNSGQTYNNPSCPRATCSSSSWCSYSVPYGGGAMPAPSPTTSATGDPHLQNIHGERFDLMKPGEHVLINIPRGVTAEKSLLRVQAAARQLGGQCADMYFQELNVTGSWAEATQTGGYHYTASRSDVETPSWVAYGKVGLKVVHGHTDSGLSYLNVYVRHLGRAGFAVGGLLGEDDHEDVSVPPSGCVRRVSLDKRRSPPHSRTYFQASTAEW